MSVAMVTYTQTKSESQTQPSEVKRTVDALAGHWSFEGTDGEPGAKEPQKVSMEVDCKPAALGAAVACTLKGKVTGFGPIEAAAVIGYNPDEQIVHWMEISSTGEYHDHKGKWQGNTIVFAPLVYTSGGKKCTEKFSLSFPAADMFTLKSVTATEDGPSTVTGAARRRYDR